MLRDGSGPFFAKFGQIFVKLFSLQNINVGVFSDAEFYADFKNQNGL